MQRKWHATLRQRPWPCGAIEDWRVKANLESGYQPGKGWLRAAQRKGRAGKSPFATNCLNCREMLGVRFHVRMI